MYDIVCMYSCICQIVSMYLSELLVGSFLVQMHLASAYGEERHRTVNCTCTRIPGCQVENDKSLLCS